MKEDKTFHLHKSKTCCNRSSRKFYNEEMLKVFAKTLHDNIIKRKEEYGTLLCFRSIKKC